MKKDTGGTWEDASRAYFTGAGGLNKYKSTNGGSYAKGYNQSTTYAKTVYANMLNFQKTRGGKYEILETLDIPENTAQTLTEIESLNAVIEGAKSQIASDLAPSIIAFKPTLLKKHNNQTWKAKLVLKTKW